ncbi:hypothetical protein C8Q76DRAFT_757360 [Earliella scabrosa]|nr:hypothetical protein C8Q76DRAFT_757360 [Earliella scabrosa]
MFPHRTTLIGSSVHRARRDAGNLHLRNLHHSSCEHPSIHAVRRVHMIHHQPPARCSTARVP